MGRMQANLFITIMHLSHTKEAQKILQTFKLWLINPYGLATNSFNIIKSHGS